MIQIKSKYINMPFITIINDKLVFLLISFSNVIVLIVVLVLSHRMLFSQKLKQERIVLEEL